MFLDSTFGDEKRTRAGIVFLVAGTLLVVWAWGSWVFRTTETPEASGKVVDSSASAEATSTGSTVAVVGLAALAGFALVGYLFLRRSRRRTQKRDELSASPGGTNDERFAQDPSVDSG
ncbi:MAG: hypothetical protein IH897_01805 [Planctomycetes bacterium]|nr:hypothetical protein [Planctomycetota bacterium]